MMGAGRRDALRRRAQIRRELAETEARMGVVFRAMESGTRDALSPVRFVQRRPVLGFALAVVGGLLLSRLLGKRASGEVIRRTGRSLLGRVVASQATRLLAPHLESLAARFIRF